MKNEKKKNEKESFGRGGYNYNFNCGDGIMGGVCICLNSSNYVL